MVEIWAVLLLYGGGVLDDLPLLARRNVRRLFGWKRVPDPTTFGRWLRRAGPELVSLLDQLLWRLVLSRWASVGQPESVTLVLDSTVLATSSTSLSRLGDCELQGSLSKASAADGNEHTGLALRARHLAPATKTPIR